MPDAPSPSADDPLSPERWDRVLSLFHEALDRPPDARTAFLRDACDSDEALYRQVTALLAADAADDDLLHLGSAWTAHLAAERKSMRGTQVGPYRVDEEIGRGGMGVVYRAHREDIGTTVAIKVLRERFPSTDHLRRFLVEQRTLGRLAHPGIARLLDAGVGGDGTPFFVMEHVDGVPITAYCAEHALSLAARLDLFQQLCAAVRYAHANLVVHRDLKPANVLVVEADDGPRVKLLDFGIAKLLGDDEGLSTRTGQHLLTPAYAAPEQVSAAPVSTATDVYALGALLYALLTGRPPLDDDDAAALPDLADRIQHQTPEAPSAVAARHEAPPVPAARLQGDLDTLCAQALRKEPARRYASVEALHDDVGRFLDHRPITARTETWTYRSAKFLRRNRTGALATLAAVLLIGGLIALYTVRLAAERDRAARQAATSDAVLEFLVETLEEGNPNAAPGDTLTIYDIVDRAEARSSTLTDRPLVRAQVLDALGRVRFVRGNLAAADSLFRQGLALRQAALPADHVDLAPSFNHLAEVQTLQGQYAAADSLLQASLALYDPTGTPSAEALSPMRLRAQLRYRQGQYAAADSLYRRVLALHERTPVLEDQALADTHQELGMATFQQGQYAAAAEHFGEAARLFRIAFPEGHHATASALANLASIERVRGQYAAAAAGYKEALAVTRRILGPRHLNIALIQNNLAVTYHRQGRVDTAAAMMAENLQLRQDLLGPEHPAVATAHNNRGEMLLDLDRYDGAGTHFRAARRIREAALGPDHQRTITTLNNIASLYEAQGELARAEALRRDVLTRYRTALGPKHPRVGTALHNLGSLLHTAGDPDAAAQYLTQALALRRAILPAEHDDLARTLEALGALRRDQTQWADAEAAFREALAIRRSTTPDHWATHHTALRLGHVLAQQRQYAAAESLLVDGYAGVARAAAPPAVRQRGQAYLDGLYAAWGRPDRARAMTDSLTRRDVPLPSAPKRPTR